MKVYVKSAELPIEPPEPKTYDKEKEYTETIEIPLDIKVNYSGNDYYEDFEDTIYQKMKDVFSEIYSNILLADREEVTDEILDLIDNEISDYDLSTGGYHITGTAKLVYQIDGIESETKYFGRDRDNDLITDKEYFTDDVDVFFDFESSYIEDFDMNYIN